MPRDPELLAECRELIRTLEGAPTLDALRAGPGWPGLDVRLERLLGTVRRFEPAHDPGSAADPGRVHALHWNLEHGNEFELIAGALATHTELRGADLLFLNEADLGMARSSNLDVAGEMAMRTCRHGAWAALFLETTLGRHDDAQAARGLHNLESLFGLALLSRWPLGAVRLVALPSPERHQFDFERMYGRHVAMIAEVLRPQGAFVAVATHLEVHRTRHDRARQMRVLLQALQGETRPVLLAGDFNTHTFDRGLPWSVPQGARVMLLTPESALRRRLLFPDRGPMREPLFDDLRAAGFAWDTLIDHAPTLRLRFDRVDEVRALARFARLPLERVLVWAERRAQLRLDWFAGRGWHGGHGHTVTGLDGPGRASDHAPLVVQVW